MSSKNDLSAVEVDESSYLDVDLVSQQPACFSFLDKYLSISCVMMMLLRC